MRILVLGGEGFIGKAACSALCDDGHEVVSVSRRRGPSQDPRVRTLETSYDNYTHLADPIGNADCIVHLAWDTTPTASAMQAALEVSANLMPLARLLDFLAASFKGHFVYASTGGALYGDRRGGGAGRDDSALSEHHERSMLDPVSYYGASKGAGELFLRAFAAQSGAPVTLLRPANVYGPGQRARHNFAVVPTLLNALRTGTPFRVRGTGNDERDYLYIDDLISALILSIGRDAPQEGTRVFNICSGRLVSVRELVALAESVTGRQTEIRFDDTAATDVRRTPLSSTHIRDALGWNATTSLEAGLEATWHWINGAQ
jgi:UDP-glucose 4-epimerase